MFYRVVRFSVVAACLGVLAGWGCSRGPSRIHPPGIDASAAGKQAIEQYDSDGDGLIKGAELDKAPALTAAIKNLDTNQDGAVSADEITARIKTWQETRLGKQSLSCAVYRRGRPLQGATVKFVPEEFLGDEIKPATGQTNEQGMAYPSVPLDPDIPDDVPGVAPGLYRVEITKQGENIPAIYNTQTTLGEEVSQDGANIMEGIKFFLK